MAVSKQHLIDQCYSEATYQKGVNYATHGQVKVSKAFSPMLDEYTLHGDVIGSKDRCYTTEVEISLQSDEIISYYCTCPVYELYGGLCKHVVATILFSEQAASNKNLISKDTQSDSSTINLIRAYTQKSIIDVFSNNPQHLAKLEPTIDISSSAARLFFKIGGERLYVIKDLIKFKSDIINNATVEYGKQFTFMHHMNAFDPPSQVLARFIMTHALEQEQHGSYYYYNRPSVESRKSIPLDTYLLDDFFAMCAQNPIKVKTDQGVVSANLERANPRLTLKLHKETNGNFRLSMPDEYTLLDGGESLYVLQDKTIFCCDKAFSDSTKELLITAARARKGINIAKDDMQLLSATIIKQVKPYMSIKSNVDIEDFEALPLVSKLYLDINNTSNVTASLKFYYGEKKHDAFKDKHPLESTDIRGELTAEALVTKYFANYDDSHNQAYIEDNEEAVFRLIDDGLAEFENCMEIYATEKFKSIQIKPPVAVSIGVRVDHDLLRLNFDLGDLDMDELLNVLNSYKQAKKYHRLKSGSFINLQNDSLQTLAELSENLNITDKELLSGDVSVAKYRALYLDNIIRQDTRIQFDRDAGFKKIVRDIKYVADSDLKVPDELKSVLRSYQKTGYRWMKIVGEYGFGGILADDMGLGKTLQVITLLLAQKKEQTEHTASLVVCPSSLVMNWQSEINKFAPMLKSKCIMGASSVRENILAEYNDADVLITSYDLLKRDIALYEGIQFKYNIIDEAQYIKNHNTQNAKAVKAVKSCVCLALTGTPVENSLSELWSIYDFLMPGYLYNYNKFKHKFETPIVKNRDEQALQGLKRLVSPFILRRLKKDVLKELPDKTETILYASMEGEQKKLYLANVASIKQDLEDDFSGSDFGKGKLQILAMLTKLRQLCCDPSLLYEDYNSESAKLNLCMELLQSCIESNHKLLLFSQFTSMLKIIEDKLIADGTKYYKIIGSTKSEDRLDLVNKFNADDTPIFLISLKAGGTGLNLTGADVVIHYDPWWNISAQNQATDRAHRIGQKNSVQIYKLIAKDTIEERILEMQKNKAELADLVIKDGDGALSSMTKDDILSLFE